MNRPNIHESLDTHDAGVAARRLSCLRDSVFTAPAGERPRRREELVELAVGKLSVARQSAEEIYDIAAEEGLEPAVAFELVRCGIAVCRFDGEVDDAPVVDTGNPQWLGDTPPPPEAVLERRLRATFRRMRGLLEKTESADAAFDAFVREPDVEDCGYPIL